MNNKSLIVLCADEKTKKREKWKEIINEKIINKDDVYYCGLNLDSKCSCENVGTYLDLDKNPEYDIILSEYCYTLNEKLFSEPLQFLKEDGYFICVIPNPIIQVLKDYVSFVQSRFIEVPRGTPIHNEIMNNNGLKNHPRMVLFRRKPKSPKLPKLPKSPKSPKSPKLPKSSSMKTYLNITLGAAMMSGANYVYKKKYRNKKQKTKNKKQKKGKMKNAIKNTKKTLKKRDKEMDMSDTVVM